MCNAFRRWGGRPRLRGGLRLRCCKRDEKFRPASAVATVTAESKGRIFKSKSKDWESNK